MDFLRERTSIAASILLENTVEGLSRHSGISIRPALFLCANDLKKVTGSIANEIPAASSTVNSICAAIHCGIEYFEELMELLLQSFQVLQLSVYILEPSISDDLKKISRKRFLITISSTGMELLSKQFSSNTG